MWSALCLGFLPIVAVTGQVTFEQYPREVTLREGDEVTFHCSMKGGDMSKYFMYWYRQGPRGSLEWIYEDYGVTYGEGFKDRFKGKLQWSKNSFTLQLLAATPGDAATVKRDKLIFGPGTILTVEPSISKTSDPEVIVMKSKKLEGGGSSGKAACLAKNFATKNISLEMPSQEVVYEQSPSILTSQGLYNAIKVVRVTKDTEVTCTAKFGNRTITAKPEAEAEEPITGFGEPNRTRTESGATDRVCNSTEPSAQDAGGQRVSMLTMAVLGLRVLLAKSIAFNALMSIKLFLF
uniref:T cell receptor alpha chain MC.7.G5-like n=1 Tax=Agelaius phoeniceus TaxID=39638 RepID=UPI0023EB9AFE|nr:T cell receptor alpha chain MC.7.G5-like [Agelaius phoeniceus]